jgi:hypothetical protein
MNIHTLRQQPPPFFFPPYMNNTDPTNEFMFQLPAHAQAPFPRRSGRAQSARVEELYEDEDADGTDVDGGADGRTEASQMLE